MEKYKCPGGHNAPCGKIVLGRRHQTEPGVSVLDDHPGCRRKYVFTLDCLVKEKSNT